MEVWVKRIVHVRGTIDVPRQAESCPDQDLFVATTTMLSGSFDLRMFAARAMIQLPAIIVRIIKMANCDEAEHVGTDRTVLNTNLV